MLARRELEAALEKANFLEAAGKRSFVQLIRREAPAVSRKPAAKIPPMDLDAEHAVLGAALQPDATEVMPQFASHLHPTDFLTEAHRTIFSRMLALYRDGQPLDHVTLAGALRNHGELDEIGGMPKIMQLVEDGLLAIPANVPAYVDQVIEASGKRRLDALGTRVRDWARNGAKVLDLVPKVSAELEQISNHRLAGAGLEPKILIGPEILSAAPAGEADWTVERLFSHRNQHMIAAASQGAKTFMLAGLGVAIAHEEIGSFLGQAVVRHGTVVFESWEQGQAEDLRKFRKLLSGHGLTSCSRNLIVISEPPATLAEPAYFDRRRRELREWKAIAYLVDSLSEASGTDLNDNAKYSEWWRARVRPVLDLGCMVVFTHLRGHPKAGVAQNRDSASRGATQIRALSTGVLETRQVSDTLFQLRHNKHRDGTALSLGLLELEGDVADDFVRLTLKAESAGNGSKEALARRLLTQLGQAHPEGHWFDRRSIEAALNAKDRAKTERVSKKIWEAVLAQMAEERLFETSNRGNATTWRWTFHQQSDDELPF